MEYRLVTFELPVRLEMSLHCVCHEEVSEGCAPGEPFHSPSKGDERGVLAQAQAKDGIAKIVPIYHYPR